jgi:hypothetical protein
MNRCLTENENEDSQKIKPKDAGMRNTDLEGLPDGLA